MITITLNKDTYTLRPYNIDTDYPRTGWDSMSIEKALKDGIALFVDQYFDVWTTNMKDYVGKIKKN